jgi:hypothetical protein
MRKSLQKCENPKIKENCYTDLSVDGKVLTESYEIYSLEFRTQLNWLRIG